MSERLPPLTALRAFEAAARHLSFAQAAAELNVTPAALSFQIKSLEEHLGLPVFHRLNRAVELTEAGRALQPGASEGFDALRRAWASALRIADTNTLTVTAGPAFTAKWLAPRLFHFAQAHPEIELRFTASLKIMDFDRDDVDVAIRFGLGVDDGLFSQSIFDEWLTPVMAPALAETIKTPADLANATLLETADITNLSHQATWAAWFDAAGLGVPPRINLKFDYPNHALDAAISGAGVALGRLSIAHSGLVDGSLVAPFPLSLTTDSQYRLVCPKGTETRPQVAAFLDWMLAEAEQMRPWNNGRHFVHVSGADGPN